MQPILSAEGKKKIFMGAFVDTGARGYDDQGYRAAMELATEIINNRSDILGDYDLVVTYRNTLVSICYTKRQQLRQNKCRCLDPVKFY